MFLHFVMFLLLGLIVGILARWRLPKAEPSGWVTPIGFAVAGSFLGGTIASALYSERGPIIFVMAALGAGAVVVVYQAIARRGVHV